MKRAVFWVVFLVVAAGIFVHQWRDKDPMRNNPMLIDLQARYYISMLSHPQPRVAQQAWLNVWNLFFTKWQVVHLLPGYAGDPTPINFLIERRAFPASGEQRAMNAFFAEDKPLFYRSDRVYCRNVGEALMAILYREGKWKVDYAGDWKAWWQANAKYYSPGGG